MFKCHLQYSDLKLIVLQILTFYFGNRIFFIIFSDLIVQNLDIAIKDLQNLKESLKNNIMFLYRAPGKNELSDAMSKVMESTFTQQEEKAHVAS